MVCHASNMRKTASSHRLLDAVQSPPTNVAAAEAICPLHLIDCLQVRQQVHVNASDG